MKLSKWLFAALTALTIGALSVNSMAQVLVPGNGSGNVNVAAGKSLTVNNTLTLSGTDNTTQTFPATSDTVAGLATSQTFTGAETFNSASTVANTFNFTSAPKFTSGPSFIDTHYATFGNTLTQNPLVQSLNSNVQTDVLVSGLTSSAMSVLLNSVSGRKIIPAGAPTIYASGTAAGATGVAIECSDGVLLVSWPIAQLVNNIPVGIGALTSNGPTLNSAVMTGCAAGTALMISNVGANLTTTTILGFNMPYVVQ